MSHINQTHTKPATEAGHPPWLMFIFLAVVFFAVYHNLSYSKRGPDNYNLSQSQLIADVTEGSVSRQIALLSLGLVAIVSLARHHSNVRLRINSSLGWVLLGFVAWASLSPIWATDIPLTLKRLAVFWIVCIAALAVARRFSIREIILWIFFTTTAFLLIGIVAELAFGAFKPFAPGYRFAGTLHPNGQGIDCGLLLLSAVAVADIEKRRRLLFRACALLGFVFLILTGSRTAFAAVLIALAAYFIAVSSTRKVVVVFGLAIGLCIPLMTAGALLPDLQSAVMLGRGDSNVDSFNGRSEIWEDCAYYVADRPIAGYGYGGFWNQSHIDQISGRENWGVAAGHSTYLECLLDLGLIGLAMYVFVLVCGVVRAFRFHRLSRNPVFAFCGALLLFCALDGFLESDLWGPTLPMFLSLVVLAGFAFVYRPAAQGILKRPDISIPAKVRHG